MSYHLYQTDAFVLDTFDVGESSRVFTLLSKEYGLIRARAQSIREAKSKLRYSLQPLWLSHISFIRGREMNKIIGAHQIAFGNSLRSEVAKKAQAQKIFSLLLRFVPEEVPDPELFKEVHQAFSFLDTAKSEELNLFSFEIVIHLRVLSRLGYLGDDKSFKPLILAEGWNPELLAEASAVSDKALSAIHASFASSQL